MELVEQYDLADVAALINELPEGHHDVPNLRYIRDNATVDGELTVKYNFSKDAGSFGRVFSGHGYQTLSKNTRNQLGHKFYTDLDVVNCFPVILAQVLSQNEIECKPLDSYVANRDDIISSITSVHHKYSREDIKKAFLVSLHCGNYKTHVTDGESIKLIDEFKVSLSLAIAKLSEKPAYTELFAKAKRKSTNAYGTFIAWVCQDKEYQCMLALKDYIENEQQGKVSVNMFDGLMILKKPPLNLCESADYIREYCNISLKIIEKPMTFDPMPAPVQNRVIFFDAERFPSADVLVDVKLKGFETGVLLNGKTNWTGVHVDHIINKKSTYKASNAYVRDNPGCEKKGARVFPLSKLYPNSILISFRPYRVPESDRHLVYPISELANIVFAAALPVQAVRKGWTTGVEIKEYDHTVNRCLPFHFDKKCLAVSAGMCLGKTLQSVNYIKKHNFKRIAFVSTRIALSRSQEQVLSGLGFVHYADGDIKTSDRIIIQYESLHRLVDAELFDLIVLDEIRSILCY